jgi:hypothetical protein
VRYVYLLYNGGGGLTTLSKVNTSTVLIIIPTIIVDVSFYPLPRLKLLKPASTSA